MQKPFTLEKQVSVIIPTHNRQHCFGRLFDYYRNWECKFLLVDSSPNRFGGEIPRQFGYFHFPGRSFCEKIQLALEEVRDPFVALCADDDVFSMRGFYSCVQKVASGECGICNGAIAKFYPDEFGKHYYLNTSITGTRHFPKGAKTPRLLAEYTQALWSVYEKNLLSEIVDIVVEAKPKNDNYIELIIASVGQCRTGVTVLPDLFLIREIAPTLSWGVRTLPLGFEYGENARLERQRIIKKVDEILSSCSVNEDFEAYMNKQSRGLFSYIRFKLYQQLAKFKIIGWHGKRETRHYNRIRWSHD